MPQPDNVPTRGERNNNPGNINYMAAGAWLGQVGMEIVPADEDYKPRFGRYDTVEHGIRALAMQLLAYRLTHGKKTMLQYTSTWAPESDDNYPTNYAIAVCQDAAVFLGQPKPEEDEVDINADVDLTQLDILAAVVHGFISVENTRDPYDPSVIRAAAAAALTAHGINLSITEAANG